MFEFMHVYVYKYKNTLIRDDVYQVHRVAQKQDGGFNSCIHNYTAITWLGPTAARYMHTQWLFVYKKIIMLNDQVAVVSYFQNLDTSS